MSDEEWARWKRTFQAGGKPMPNIIKRAQTDRRRAILGLVGFYVIVAGELAVAIPGLRAARTAVEAAAPLVVILGTAMLAAGLHVSIRGTWGVPAQTPLALLDALENRHAGRLRLMRFMPWATALLIAGTIGSVVASMVSAGRFDVAGAAATAAVSVTTAAFVWFVLDREGKQIARERREAAEARRLLTEDGEP